VRDTPGRGESDALNKREKRIIVRRFRVVVAAVCIIEDRKYGGSRDGRVASRRALSADSEVGNMIVDN
jgi:hypothetical protein